MDPFERDLEQEDIFENIIRDGDGEAGGSGDGEADGSGDHGEAGGCGDGEADGSGDGVADGSGNDEVYDQLRH